MPPMASALLPRAPRYGEADSEHCGQRGRVRTPSIVAETVRICTKNALEAAKGFSARNKRRVSYPGMLTSNTSSGDGSRLGEALFAHFCLLLSPATKGSSW
eukprot:5504823-Pyramimonas_sp.AAC.1